MPLPHNEWLAKAQALPVGQSRRTYHNEENRANLVVGNDVDRWWAYCHRCHEGGVLMKEHVDLSQAVQQQERVMPWPADAVPYGTDPVISQYAWRMLLPKGIDLHSMLPGVPMYTSKEQQRLIVGSAQGWLGRALGNVQPKWVAYRSPGKPVPVYAGHPHDTVQGTVVLTEDYFSALKIRWSIQDASTQTVQVPGMQGAQAARATAVAALGTSLHTRLLAALLACDRVLVSFDGDRAGRDGTVAVARRLRALGKPVTELRVPDGLDPKDMRSDQIKELLCLTADSGEAPTQAAACTRRTALSTASTGST